MDACETADLELSSAPVDLIGHAEIGGVVQTVRVPVSALTGLIESETGARLGYLTQAAMYADTAPPGGSLPPAGRLVRVSADPDPLKNGDYLKINGATTGAAGWDGPRTSRYQPPTLVASGGPAAYTVSTDFDTTAQGAEFFLELPNANAAGATFSRNGETPRPLRDYGNQPLAAGTGGLNKRLLVTRRNTQYLALNVDNAAHTNDRPPRIATENIRWRRARQIISESLHRTQQDNSGRVALRDDPNDPAPNPYNASALDEASGIVVSRLNQWINVNTFPSGGFFSINVRPNASCFVHLGSDGDVVNNALVYTETFVGQANSVRTIKIEGGTTGARCLLDKPDNTVWPIMQQGAFTVPAPAPAFPAHAFSLVCMGQSLGPRFASAGGARGVHEGLRAIRAREAALGVTAANRAKPDFHMVMAAVGATAILQENATNPNDEWTFWVCQDMTDPARPITRLSALAEWAINRAKVFDAATNLVGRPANTGRPVVLWQQGYSDLGGMCLRHRIDINLAANLQGLKDSFTRYAQGFSFLRGKLFQQIPDLAGVVVSVEGAWDNPDPYIPHSCWTAFRELQTGFGSLAGVTIAPPYHLCARELDDPHLNYVGIAQSGRNYARAIDKALRGTDAWLGPRATAFDQTDSAAAKTVHRFTFNVAGTMGEVDPFEAPAPAGGFAVYDLNSTNPVELLGLSPVPLAKPPEWASVSGQRTLTLTTAVPVQFPRPAYPDGPLGMEQSVGSLPFASRSRLPVRSLSLPIAA